MKKKHKIVVCCGSRWDSRIKRCMICGKMFRAKPTVNDAIPQKNH